MIHIYPWISKTKSKSSTSIMNMTYIKVFNIGQINLTKYYLVLKRFNQINVKYTNTLSYKLLYSALCSKYFLHNTKRQKITSNRFIGENPRKSYFAEYNDRLFITLLACTLVKVYCNSKKHNMLCGRICELKFPNCNELLLALNLLPL